MKNKTLFALLSFCSHIQAVKISRDIETFYETAPLTPYYKEGEAPSRWKILKNAFTRKTAKKQPKRVRFKKTATIIRY